MTPRNQQRRTRLPGFLTAGRVALFGVLAGVGVWPLLAAAQSPAPPASTLRFEVISVKKNLSGDTSMRVRNPGDMFDATNIRIVDLIRTVYNVQSFQLVGGPAWLLSDRFDIRAKADKVYPPGPQGVSPEFVTMVKAMLADRFGVRTHQEVRQLPVFALRALKPGQVGPGMKRVEVDCQAAAAAAAAAAPAQGPPACTLRIATGALTGRGMTLAQLATALTRVAGIDRAVLDRTELTGSFDVDLKWNPAVASPSGEPAGQLSDAPSVFTAVQEQLGLRLQADTGPVEVLVIDEAQQPAEN
jgi:uncharacterized protein (TIGR03435 family)